MSLIRDYTAQTVLGTLQSVVVVGGWMCFATVLKTRGYPDPSRYWPDSIVFVRNWGMLWLLIPAAWILFSVWMERRHYDFFSQKETVITGVGVLLLLALYFFALTARAGSSLIQGVEKV